MRVYLDHSASTPIDPEVLEVMLPYLREDFGNASSIHTYGQKARSAVEEARDQVAALIGASPREIVFTSGGTEADNLALRGRAELGNWRSPHVITSTIEHPAVLHTCQALQRRGIRVSYIGVDQEARVNLEQLRAAFDDETILVSVMHANNETGTIQDIEAIVALARSRGVAVHTDAVQTAGKLPLDVRRLEIDLLTLSAHKIHGPKGIGVLFVRRGLDMVPWLHGGHQERGRRPGTENVAAIVGMGRAADLARRRLDEQGVRLSTLRDRMEQEILGRIPGVRVNGSREHRLPHISNLSFEGVEGEGLTIALDLEGIAVSTGSACSSGSLEPSHVLLAMGRSRSQAQGSIRLSLGWTNNDGHVRRLLEILPGIVERLRSFAPGEGFFPVSLL